MTDIPHDYGNRVIVSHTVATPTLSSHKIRDLIEFLAACKRIGLEDTDTVTIEHADQSQTGYHRIVATRIVERGDQP